MAYEYHSWKFNEQAAESEASTTGYGVSYNGDVDTAAIWDSAYEEAAIPFDPMEMDADATDTGLIQNTPTLGQPSNQAGQEQQIRVANKEIGIILLKYGQELVMTTSKAANTSIFGFTLGLKSVAEHIYQVNAAFEKKNIDYHLSVQNPVSPGDLALWGPCRRYALPRDERNIERRRLQFLQVFNCDRQYNKALSGYRYKMSVAYEPSRNPLPTRSYPAPGDHDRDHESKVTGFNPLNPNGDPTLVPPSSPTPSTTSLAPTTPPDGLTSPIAFTTESKPNVPKGPPRMKPIPKPQRQVVKNSEGKFICTWHDCTAPIKEFLRKCEWSKHMDKHERPYKCLAVGCENIPGFTYSGGLLRHEREVHRKHGGPKNPLYCPHKGCKRHKDSSFARLENLNEHLRRCHTSNEFDSTTQTEELATRTQSTNGRIKPLPVVSSPVGDGLSPGPSTASPSPRLGDKRKADDDDLREENKRLRFENQELKRKIEAGYLQQSAMMEQIDSLEKEKAALLSQLGDVDLVGRAIS
ncbi:hypothetical protein FHL15_002065 [Xylaria flabelliformis]|uniref:C2H2-type domain-containing protein n=1 Tax=Xylaria flabelliformis TaxID=2512241 RepID=A0A553IAN7_9PEZI|nr:hypothetical protein FHL15_002065 [Xylaria flabelliformis]